MNNACEFCTIKDKSSSILNKFSSVCRLCKSQAIEWQILAASRLSANPPYIGFFMLTKLHRLILSGAHDILAALCRGSGLFLRYFCANQTSSSYFNNASEEFLNLCDASLIAEDKNFPIHSGILGKESTVLCKTLSDLKKEGKPADSEFTVKLDDTVSADDTKLMLSFVYGARTTAETVGSCTFKIINICEGKHSVEEVLMFFKLTKIAQITLRWCISFKRVFLIKFFMSFKARYLQLKVQFRM